MAAPTIVAGLKQFFAQYSPYAQLDASDLDLLIGKLEVAYFGPDELLLAPAEAAPDRFFIIRQGRVQGVNREQGGKVAFAGRVGDSFPVGALRADRPVSLTYTAVGDTFCLVVPREVFATLVERSSVFRSFCERRLGALLDLSRQQLQASYAAQTSAERSFGVPLAELVHGAPITCTPDTPLRDAFAKMNEAKVGSILVRSPPDEAPVGILTRTDLIGRVILPQVALDAPIEQVMSRHVLSLDGTQTAADASLLMAQHGIRHVPVVSRQGGTTRLIGIVSERDLFALQRLSLRQLAESVRGAREVEVLAVVAADIRRLSYNLVAQGVAAEQMTRLISHLNDQLVERLVVLSADQAGIATDSFCWLALGSEGRAEQTIATDQDNGLLYAPGQPVEPLLKMADAINLALDRCGFPLCKGDIMARNPAWCLDAPAWAALFAGWIDRGDPQALLNASVFFDLRGLIGQTALATQLRSDVLQRAQGNRRFLKQMADNALRNRAPSGGLFDGLLGGGEPSGPIDLKMSGTVPFVDAARIWTLAAGIDEVNTSRRLRALAAAGKLPQADADNWIDAFEFMQLMRLRTQHQRAQRPEAEQGDNPNVIDPATLSALDRRSLRESFRQARKVQQRLELDFPG
jgi:CBS domain-containing protein